jgi:AGZA family xanthine/uracil permease-like MFS transporter
MRALDQHFGVTTSGSTIRQEIIGGLTTFATMSYIVFVQPTVLGAAGMPFGGVLLATCVAAAIGCFLMGTLARYPFSLAPGMGENFFFAFVICGTMGFSWQNGLGITFIAGLLFLGLSLFGVREKIMNVLPEGLKNAIGPAIGIFIAFVGMQWGGIVTPNPATIVSLGDITRGAPLTTLGGVLLIAALIARGIRGGILIGILATCLAGYLSGIMPAPADIPRVSGETVFALRFDELRLNWQDALLAIGLLFFMDLFDTVGTLVGVSKQAGFIGEDGKLPRAGRAFFSDAAASCAGGLLGTSTLTTYVESATGVAAGARTGLAAIVTGICFLFAILLAPVVRFVGQDIGPAFYGVEATAPHIAMYPGVAPALIVVGFLMMAPLRNVDWEDITESLPAFLTIAMMVFGFAIHEGISAGCVSFVAVKVAAGRFKDVHPIMYVIAILLAARYVLM